jgi:hypothetical protein
MVEPTISEHRRRARAVLRRASGTRSTIAFAALLVCSASFAPDAHTQVVGETGTVKQITAGCSSHKNLRTLLLSAYFGASASDALQRYNCVVLHEGETVVIEQELERDSVGNWNICVRRLNDSDCYWMRFDDLKSRGKR